MNRRTFLKAIGLAIAAPGAVLGAVKKPLTMGVDVATGESSSVISVFEIPNRYLGSNLKAKAEFRKLLQGRYNIIRKHLTLHCHSQVAINETADSILMQPSTLNEVIIEWHAKMVRLDGGYTQNE